MGLGITEEQRQQVRDLQAKGYSLRKISAKLGLSYGAVWNRLNGTPTKPVEDDNAPPAEIPTGESFTRDAKGDNEILTAVSRTARTLEDVLAVAKVDLAVWEVERYVVNKWDCIAKVRSYASGFKGNTATDWRKELAATELWQVKVWLRRKVSKPIADAAGMLLARIAAHAPRYPKLPKVRPPADRHLLEISIADAHFGKLAWAAETGENYDLKIAERIWRDAVTGLVSMAAGFNVERFLLPIGNDFYNVDNLIGTTTAGTRQDGDGRYAKIMTCGQMSAVWAVEYLAARGPVHVLQVGGNHDRQTSWHLAQFIKAWFRHCPHITVDDSPAPQKRYTYGSNLIGFSHGNEEAHRSLPAIMATLWPEEWAATKGGTREWHLGHWHKEKQTDFVSVDEYDGVRVRVLPSISGKDYWHALKQYLGRRAAEAHLYSYDRGHAGNFTYNVPREAAA